MPAQISPGDFSNSTNGSLADILFSLGAISEKARSDLKLSEVQSGKSAESIVLDKKLVDETTLVKAKSQLYGISYADLSISPTSPEALATITQEVAERFKILPLSIDRANKSLSLAMVDPLDLSAIEFVEQKTGLHVKAFYAEESQIKSIIETSYASSLSKEVTAALKDVIPEAEKIKTLGYTQRPGLIREEKIVEVVRHMLEFAVTARASDIHVEPQEKITRVRYRVDGILQEKLVIPKQLHESLISRIKILSGMKIEEKRIPQDGRFNFKTGNEDIDLRVSSLPTTWGEKIVMRLLKKTGGIPGLPELGLRGRALKNLGDAILRPHGIIIICGPTGSGKTTTLYSLISRINTASVNIVTLEDPIEYKIPGVNQVQVNPTIGLTFASGLRSFLRQDPNIILVGEIRDRETADLAIQASLTGHLVFSTLHTNDAAGALPRLLDMGAEPFLLASSMTAVVAQRVLRKIDVNSKEGYSPDAKVVEDMKNVLGPLWNIAEPVTIYKGKPTADNNNSGYLGRIGIFEVMPISEKIGKLILERSASTAIEHQAREDGMVTLKQDGYMKVVEGISSIEEVLRVAQE